MFVESNSKKKKKLSLYFMCFLISFFLIVNFKFYFAKVPV